MLFCGMWKLLVRVIDNNACTKRTAGNSTVPYLVFLLWVIVTSQRPRFLKDHLFEIIKL